MRLLNHWKTSVCLLALAFAFGGATAIRAQNQGQGQGQDQNQNQNPDEDQDPTGGIRGTISDPSGASVPNARITVGGGPGPAVDTTADSAGDYSIKLPQGNYSVMISAPGFKVFQQDDVEILADMLPLDVTLQREKDAKSAQQMLAHTLIGRQLR